MLLEFVVAVKLWLLFFWEAFIFLFRLFCLALVLLEPEEGFELLLLVALLWLW